MTPLPITPMYAHQEAAFEKLRRLRVGALLMEMGTGKSLVAMALACCRWGRIRRVLWFCPVSLKHTIVDEIGKHLPGASVHRFDEHTRQGCIPAADWYVIGTESMSSSVRVQLAALELAGPDAMVIVDESSYIKSPWADRTHWITEAGKRAGWRLVLTGTPISKGIIDLFAQMRFLSPDILGYSSFYSFAANHLEYSEKYPGKIVRAHNQGLLAAKMAPYVYQVRKEECLDLPDKVYSHRSFGMTAAQRDLYERAKSTILDEIDAWEDQFDSTLVYRLFTALQQCACGFWNYRRLRTWDEIRRREPRPEVERVTAPCLRLDTLKDTLREIGPDEKVILWVKYVEELEKIRAMLLEEFGEEAALYYGELSERERAASVARFRGPARFFLATPGSGGHGLTLNEAAYVVGYTASFNWSEMAQAEDRNHRIGQSRKVTYIYLYCRGTIDERIQENLASKGRLIAEFERRVEQIRDKRTLKQALREMTGE